MAEAHTGWRIGAMSLAWLAGVALHLQQRSLDPLAHQLGLVVAGVLAVVVPTVWARSRGRGARVGAARRRDPIVLAMVLVGSALFGAGVAGTQASLRLADALDPALEGRDLDVVGVVAALPQAGANGLRFRFEVETASVDGETLPVGRSVPARVQLTWYARAGEDAGPHASPAALRAGQRWRFTVRLRRPHGNLNPHGFDHELHLFEQGVRATGYVRDAPAEKLLEHAGQPVERMRQRVRDAIDATVTDRRSAGVLAALAVGDQGAIAREDWDLFRNTGVAHLMAISGLHVTMFAWIAGGAIGWVWRRSSKAPLWLATPHAARWGGLMAAAAYALLAGWGVPSQRTVWMLACVTVLRAAGLRWPWGLVLSCAAVVVTAVDPWALLQAGFWLSFGAVGLLLASEPEPSAHGAPRAGPAGWMRAALAGAWQSVRRQGLVTLGLTPLTLVFFQQVAWLGLFANLLAIPLVTLLITPLALLGVLWPALWNAGSALIQAMGGALSTLASGPGAVWLAPAAPGWAQAAGLGAAALFAIPAPWRVRMLAIPLVLPLLWPAPERPASGRFEVVAVDVGQGTAVLVRTREHLLVYDTGPLYSRDSDAGQRVLLPLLRARGEARIDRLVLSHRDSDHVGGAAALLAALPVAQLLGSLEPGHPLLEGRPNAQRCAEGQSWTWDEVHFEVLAPPVDDHARGLRPNALSCVLRVRSSTGSVLLTGDIEREQELALLQRHGDALQSDVLLVPHHGSRTSSSAPFVAAVRPREAVVQAGYRNRFGHPAPEVQERWRAAGARVVSSPECGAWLWVDASTGDGAPAGRCQRDSARRYWHWRDASPASGH